MQRHLTDFANWIIRHRARLPQWAQRVLEMPARRPDSMLGRLTMRVLGGRTAAPNTDVPEAEIRVYVAPTNYSGQGYLWSRALEAAEPGVAARSMAESLPGGFDFPADTLVPFSVAQGSDAWADAEWNAVKRFTHVLVEAERPIFGRRFDRSPRNEILALSQAGVSVAYLCHGTDIRDPDRHARLTPWSLYPEDPRTAILRDDARRNFDLISTVRRPTFVSTPDLLLDVPWATWCPVVINLERFRMSHAPFTHARARVVHAASAPLQKGTHYIEPALRPLLTTGRVSLELITGRSSSEMPAVFADADIVIDQFRAGSYGVAACEAMASGRVVIGHVVKEVREIIRGAVDLELPIVEATPDTLHDVVVSLIEDPDRSRALAAAGRTFVERVHSGALSAEVLLTDWIRG
jgi:hypothetical protein